MSHLWPPEVYLCRSAPAVVQRRSTVVSRPWPPPISPAVSAHSAVSMRPPQPPRRGSRTRPARSFDLLLLARLPRLRSAPLFRPRIFKELEATLLQHKHAPYSPGSCGFLGNLLKIPMACVTPQRAPGNRPLSHERPMRLLFASTRADLGPWSHGTLATRDILALLAGQG
jgi:hypothetical protein